MRKFIIATAVCATPVVLGSSTDVGPASVHEEVRFYAYCGAAYTYLSAFYGKDRDSEKSARFDALARGSESASTYLVLTAMGDGDRGAAQEMARTIAREKMSTLANLVADRRIELFTALVSTCEDHEDRQASYAARLPETPEGSARRADAVGEHL